MLHSCIIAEFPCSAEKVWNRFKNFNSGFFTSVPMEKVEGSDNNFARITDIKIKVGNWKTFLLMEKVTAYKPETHSISWECCFGGSELGSNIRSNLSIKAIERKDPSDPDEPHQCSISIARIGLNEVSIQSVTAYDNKGFLSLADELGVEMTSIKQMKREQSSIDPTSINQSSIDSDEKGKHAGDNQPKVVIGLSCTADDAWNEFSKFSMSLFSSFVWIKTEGTGLSSQRLLKEKSSLNRFLVEKITSFDATSKSMNYSCVFGADFFGHYKATLAVIENQDNCSVEWSTVNVPEDKKPIISKEFTTAIKKIAEKKKWNITINEGGEVNDYKAENWTCKRCRYSNTDAYNKCDLCNTPRGYLNIQEAKKDDMDGKTEGDIGTELEDLNHSWVRGPGVEDGKLQEVMKISIHASPNTSDCTVVIEDSDNRLMLVMIRPTNRKRITHEATYFPTEPGQYKIDIKVGGENLEEYPKTITLKTDNSNPSKSQKRRRMSTIKLKSNHSKPKSNIYVREIKDMITPTGLSEELLSYTFVLPNITDHAFTKAFQEYVKQNMHHADHHRTLVSTKVINWNSALPPLVPLQTKEDANSLFHAVSMAMWGIQDRELKLREAVRQTLQSEDFREKMDDRKEVYSNFPEKDRLEHLKNLTCPNQLILLALAHILKRTIIVYADSRVYKNDFDRDRLKVKKVLSGEERVGGIYLPLFHEKQARSLLALTFIHSVFNPLVGMEMKKLTKKKDEYTFPSDESTIFFPLINSEKNPLYTHFLKPNELLKPSESPDLLKQYLTCNQIKDKRNDKILCAVQKIKPRTDNLQNCLKEYLEQLQKTVDKLSNEEKNDLSEGKSKEKEKSVSGICLNKSCRMVGYYNFEGFCSKCGSLQCHMSSPTFDLNDGKGSCPGGHTAEHAIAVDRKLRCNISGETIDRGDHYWYCGECQWYARMNHYSRYHPDAIQQTGDHPTGGSHSRGNDSAINNIMKFEGGGWILVRQICKGKSWHMADDNLAGTTIYAMDNAKSFSHIFCQEEFDQFLFVTGDRRKWLMADRKEVNGENYTADARKIIKSSNSSKPSKAVWYNRVGRSEDPWISTVDHHLADQDNNMLYGEGRNGGHAQALEAHNGCQVFIRNSDNCN